MAILGNILHPRSGEETSPSPAITAHLIQDHNEIWLFAHATLLVMVPLMAIGFVGLFRFLYSKEKHYSLVGLILVSLWAVLSLFVFVLDGLTGAQFSNMSPNIFEYNYYLSLTITVVSFLIHGPAIAAFSLSAMKARVFPNWLNGLGVAIGTFTIVAYASGIFGTYMVYSPIFPAYAALATLWSLIVGLQLMRSNVK